MQKEMESLCSKCGHVFYDLVHRRHQLAYRLELCPVIGYWSSSDGKVKL